MPSSTSPRVICVPCAFTEFAYSVIECFFNKDGKWYYAGVYKTFRLKDITPQEWNKLPAEVRFRCFAASALISADFLYSLTCALFSALNQTTQAIVKETVQYRKNTSPQNVYEVGQLYAAGALKAACIGLQCIGFNGTLYKKLLAQAETCAKTGRWRGAAVGLGTGALWNANVGSGQADAARSVDDAKAGFSGSLD